MDVGVGSFVFSLGLVSARAVSAASSGNMPFAVFKALKKASPILVLGLIRVLMVKGTEYPVSQSRVPDGRQC
jgi:phosphatidylinositol glycan class W